jgi:hypothetical protein
VRFFIEASFSAASEILEEVMEVSFTSSSEWEVCRVVNWDWRDFIKASFDTFEEDREAF